MSRNDLKVKATLTSAKSLPTMDHHYRPEIDGLRAIAVLAVVLYHAGLGAPGGFVGVDVFFVISGFLITTLIVKDLEAGTFSLTSFWERRVRRIFPALACLVVGTLLIGWFVLLPDDFAQLGRSALYQSFFAANFYFWRSSGYFDGIAEEKPLLHTWSLAVEEQFYLLFPMFLLGLFAIPSLRRHPAWLIALGIGMAISLGISIWGVLYRPVATFYLLPTRAWELLLGGWIALLPSPVSDIGIVRRVMRSRVLRETLSLLAMLGILLPCWLYSAATPFPGLAAMPPCLATGLFIWLTGQPQSTPTQPVVVRLLTTRPIVFVGLISYSLYLWHWPLFAFSRYLSIEPLSTTHRVGLIIASLVLAAWSWRFVEQPFRKRSLCTSRRAMLAGGAMSMGVIATLGLAIQLRVVPQRFTPEALAYAKGHSDSAFLDELEIEDVVAGRLPRLGISTAETPIDYLVWGDSHAMAAAPGFDEYLKMRGLAGQLAVHSDTAPLLGYFKSPHSGMGRNAPEFNAEVLEHIKQLRIPHVVLIASWRSYEQPAATHPDSQPFEDSLLATVHAIRDAGAKPWIMLEIPTAGFNVPRILALNTMAGKPIEPLCARPDPAADAITRTTSLVKRLQAAGANLLDPRPYCLSQDGTYYRVAANGKSLYRDAGHLTTHGAKVVIVPLLEDNLPTLLEQQQQR